MAYMQHVSLFSGAKENSIKLEVRMHSNRKIVFKRQTIAVRDLVEKFGILPKGLQNSATRTRKGICGSVENRKIGSNN